MPAEIQIKTPLAKFTAAMELAQKRAELFDLNDPDMDPVFREFLTESRKVDYAIIRLIGEGMQTILGDRK